SRVVTVPSYSHHRRTTISHSFHLYCFPPHPALHSFPTRRSSDLLSLNNAQITLNTITSETSGTVNISNSTLANTGKIENQNITRSEEHTSELQSRFDIVCRLLLEKKKEKKMKLPFLLTNISQ